MIEHRWEARARLEDGMTEARVGGGVLQLVTVCLSDDGAGEVSDVQGRPGQARACRHASASE